MTERPIKVSQTTDAPPAARPVAASALKASASNSVQKTVGIYERPAARGARRPMLIALVVIAVFCALIFARFIFK